MKKVMAMPENITEICSKLRRYFFASDSDRDFKDSYVINRAVENYTGDLEELHSEAAANADKMPKISKSITFRANVFARVSALAESSDLTYGEVVRRILFITVKQIEENKPEKPAVNPQIEVIKGKILVISKRLEDVMSAIEELSNEVAALELNFDNNETEY